MFRSDFASEPRDAISWLQDNITLLQKKASEFDAIDLIMAKKLRDIFKSPEGKELNDMLQKEKAFQLGRNDKFTPEENAEKGRLDFKVNGTVFASMVNTLEDHFKEASDRSKHKFEKFVKNLTKPDKESKYEFMLAMLLKKIYNRYAILLENIPYASRFSSIEVQTLREFNRLVSASDIKRSKSMGTIAQPSSSLTSAIAGLFKRPEAKELASHRSLSPTSESKPKEVTVHKNPLHKEVKVVEHKNPLIFPSTSPPQPHRKYSHSGPLPSLNIQKSPRHKSDEASEKPKSPKK